MIPVAMRLGETPVPIPNTMVKTQAADGTILETIWESRWLPDLLQKQPGGGGLLKVFIVTLVFTSDQRVKKRERFCFLMADKYSVSEPHEGSSARQGQGCTLKTEY